MDYFRSPPPPKPISMKERICTFLGLYWRGLVIIIAPLVASTVIFTAEKSPPEKWRWCAYTLCVMAIYWVTECIPLPVTAFLPLITYPLSEIMNTFDACKCYMNNTLLMFLGSLMLAYSIEQSNLHVRIALGVVKSIGYSHYKLLFGISMVTMFISMWITNTAATVMILPIVTALLTVFESQGLLKRYDVTEEGGQVASDIATCYYCAVTYSATIGGIGTLVGTGTNLAFKGLFEKTFPAAPDYLSFPYYSAFAVPYMVVMEFAMYLCMILVYFGFLRPKSKLAKGCIITEAAKKAAKQRVDSDWIALGAFTLWELWVAILFSSAMLLFFCRAPTIFKGWGDIIEDHHYMKRKDIKDATAAFFSIFFMLVIPNSCIFFKNFTAKTRDQLPKGPIRAVLSWRIMDSKLPYSFLFLLGGGFALSNASSQDYTNFNAIIGDQLMNLKSVSNEVIILLLIIVTTFFTNFASNVAIANVVCPIGMELAKQIGVMPMWYDLVCGVSASYCFCLPVGTPGNLVVQSATQVPTPKMVKAGALPTLTTILVSWVFLLYWAPVIWPDVKHEPWNMTWTNFTKPTK